MNLKALPSGRTYLSLPRDVQISGGHKYLPPKQDVNAPDLYIPTMSVGTYCLLLCLAAATRAKFKPEVMTAAVRSLARQRGLASQPSVPSPKP